jgi:uncharacterized protein (DUF934 family)
MPDLVLKGEQMVSDNWYFLGADESIPETRQPLVFPLSRWREERALCLAHAGDRGVAMANTDCVTHLVPDLDQLRLVCIDFPSAVDGRGYSQARILRERYGYKYELRATGDVLVDQLFLLRRCGFDAFTLCNPECDVSKYLDTFSYSYQ